MKTICEHGPVPDDGAVCGYCADSAPVPPAGDVEVLGWKVESQGELLRRTCRTLYIQRPDWAYREDPKEYSIIELVDRANVTRLEERCGRLDYDYVTVQADLREMTAERDGLLAEVERKQGELSGAQAMLETAYSERDQLKDRVDKLNLCCSIEKNLRQEAQSELTKARELLRSMTTDYACCLEAGFERITGLGGDCDSVEKMLDDNRDYAEARAFLAHQSAPAACPKCNGTGEADSGGVQPWGEGINIPCDCQSAPAAKGESGKCWSCRKPVTLADCQEADGERPHCRAEINKAEDLKP